MSADSHEMEFPQIGGPIPDQVSFFFIKTPASKVPNVRDPTHALPFRPLSEARTGPQPA